MVNERTTMSDNTHDHRRRSGQVDHLFDIRSQLELLHKLHVKVDDERKKNRTLIAIVGMLVLVAEITGIITKLLKD